jgi:hypothetical protein
MVTVNVVIDLGKSLVKAIWNIPASKKKQVLFLEPEIVNLTADDVANIEVRNANPENDAWLTFADGTGQALGFITRKDAYRGRPTLGREKIKATQGVSRCLAVVGAIAQREGFPNEFSIAFSVLLPLSEWSSREEFKQELLTALTEFHFRGETYHCSVIFSDVKPEGLGLLLQRQLQIPKPVFRERGILCLMMGHFNNSLYFYKNGQKLVDECSARGFHLIVDTVLDETALDGSNLASEAVVGAIYDGPTDGTKIKQLLWNKVGSEQKLENQVVQVREVINKAKVDHWQAIGQWINECLGANRFEVDEVLISGGASRFFISEVEGMFSEVPVLWSTDLNQLVAQDFQLSPDSIVAHRLADAYSIFSWLSQSVSKVAS